MTAIVFPGQGSQFKGMSKEFYDNFPKVREIFELISNITNINIKKIIFENPDDLLHQTQYTQIAIFCVSISYYKTFISYINLENTNINFMLGHSLGEYTALCASNILSIEDAAFLLKKRGELMQNAYEPNKSGMAAIIGIDSKKAEIIIKEKNLNLQIANDNSPQQVVLSGTIESLNNAEKIFISEGVKKFIPLKVSAAFHSPLMLSAEEKMKEFIDNTTFKNSSISIISNSTGKITKDNSEIVFNLLNQMSSRVRWVESIVSLEKASEYEIIEIGPGKVLSGLIKRISSNFKIKNFNAISDIKEINDEF